MRDEDDDIDDEDEEAAAFSEKMIQNFLVDLLETTGEIQDIDGDLVVDIRDVETFRSAGIMTRDKGLVVTLKNKQKFQITVSEDRRG